MHETYFEEMLKMGDTKDYKSKRPPNQLYAICKCKGRVPRMNRNVFVTQRGNLLTGGRVGVCGFYLTVAPIVDTAFPRLNQTRGNNEMVE